jgi:signal transduction histidine kinase
VFTRRARFTARKWPIRLRLTLMTSCLAAAVCVVTTVLVFIAVRGRAVDYEREQASGAALRTVHLIKRDRLPSVLPGDRAEAIQVLNASGRVVASNKELAGKPPIAGFRPGEDSVRADRVLCPPRGMSGCKVVVSFRVYEEDGDWTVYAAKHAVQWYVSPTLLAFFAGGSVLLVLLTALGTSRTVSRTLAPVNAIRSELAEITASASDRRVPVPDSSDEIRLLAETANATLDRLDAALEQMRRFTSDASHDLRSPITAMRTRIEGALLHQDDTDWPETAQAALASLDQLQAIVTDLLTLARLDAGVPRDQESIDLSKLVTTELEHRVRTKELMADLADGVTMTGDRLRLTRLLTNLLDNAERHAAEQVTVTVRSEIGSAVLEVRDDGTGIAPEHRETVFQRFARLDAARSRDAGGTGLGLPIARDIAEAHGGSLTIEDSRRGARFVLRLPADHHP